MANLKSMLNIRQVCFVVKDMKAMMACYASLGVGPFKVYSMDTREMTGVTYRGKPAEYSLDVAWAPLGPWALELLQPKRGQSIYTEFLEKHGEGLHHLGIYLDADEYEAGYTQLVEQGFEQIQGGPIDGLDRVGRFDYFQTEAGFGIILELLDMPGDLGEPAYVYPETVAEE